VRYNQHEGGATGLTMLRNTFLHNPIGKKYVCIIPITNTEYSFHLGISVICKSVGLFTKWFDGLVINYRLHKQVGKTLCIMDYIYSYDKKQYDY
jgi:hypothetical protein